MYCDPCKLQKKRERSRLTMQKSREEWLNEPENLQERLAALTNWGWSEQERIPYPNRYFTSDVSITYDYEEIYDLSKELKDEDHREPDT